MYNSADIPDRIKSLAKARKIAIKTMLIDLSMGPNTMSNFKTSMPKSDTLARIADYLDCSVDYLLGRTDDPQSHKTQGAANRWNEGIELEQRARPLAAQNNKSVDQ